MSAVMETPGTRAAGRDRPNAGPPRVQAELAALLGRAITRDGECRTAVPALRLFRNSAPTGPSPSVYEPALCVIAQGRKRLLLGDEVFRYDPAHYVIVAVDLPLTGEVVEATPASPYLGLRLALDPGQIAALVAESSVAEGLVAEGDASDRPDGGRLGWGVLLGQLDALLVDALARLVRLLDRPQHIGGLAPLVTREILYLLLAGPSGPRLRAIGLGDGGTGNIAEAFRQLRHDFAAPLRIDVLARRAHMSASAFHRRFKTVAAMTPLQYQHRLRLLEARRLMLGGAADARTAAARVGYGSESQFSREYRRLFGDPPRRDVARLRAAADVTGAAMPRAPARGAWAAVRRGA